MFEVYTTGFICVLVFLNLYLFFKNCALSTQLRNERVYSEYNKGKFEKAKAALKKAMKNDYRHPVTKQFISKEAWLELQDV